MAAAAKAAKAEARSKTAAKTATAKTEASVVETKKAADQAPRLAEPQKQEARNASLFDTGPAPTAVPVPASDADEDEEILAEIGEDEPTDESGEFDEAA
jgi:hypothetical protein